MFPAAVLSLLALMLCALGCGASSAGRACAQSSDCDSLQTCNTALPGGFCVKPCTTPGSTAECPGGTICTQNATLFACAPVCTEQAQCREGYECTGVSGSSAKSCRPKA